MFKKSSFSVTAIFTRANDAEPLERHFLETDMSEYFPKLLQQLVKLWLRQMNAWTNRRPFASFAVGRRKGHETRPGAAVPRAGIPITEFTVWDEAS